MHLSSITTVRNKADLDQEGSSIRKQNFNENLETVHLSPTLFYHLPGAKTFNLTL